jgi:uncharacterized membrane protein YoaT (DUF817 family)
MDNNMVVNNQYWNYSSLTIVFSCLFPKLIFYDLLLTFKNAKKALNRMKFLAILSAVVFAAFAVAGPTQTNSQDESRVEKRQVCD